MSRPIAGSGHPLVRHARRLRQRKHRREAGAFLVEGPRGFLAAVETGAPIEAVLCCPDLLTSAAVWAAIAGIEGSAAGEDRRDLGASLGKAGGVGGSDGPVGHDARRGPPPIVAVTPETFASLSERDNPTGIAAIVRMAARAIDDLAVPGDGLFVALAGVSDPGNVGTILRTMDAVGATGLVVVGPAATDPYHPTAVKASMGALFTVPIAEAGWDGLWRWAEARGVTPVGTSARAAVDHWSPGSLGRPPWLLVMGGEREGLPPEVMARCPRRVRIPMGGSVSSLNLAVATALLLYEARRP